MLEESKSEKQKDFLLYIIVLALIIAGLVLTARNAADGYMYFAWANYFATFDLTELSSYPKSVTGVPLVHWSYGSGILPATVAVILGYASALSIYSVAAFLGMANAILLVYIAHLRTNSFSKATLILAAVILFTPAGFYFNKYSSEGWTVFLVLSGLTLIEWNRRYSVRASNYAVLILGVFMYFLVLVKIQNIVLCLSLWVIFIANNFLTPIKSKENLRFLLEKTSIVLAVGGIGLVFLFAFNHVVSGNFLTSPYSVGDMEFSTFSMRNLKIKEVLFSSWHGLLFYHPVAGLAVYFLLRELMLERASVMKSEFLIICSCLVAFALQILIQSAWVIWWMGTGTFGARGFCGAVILLAYGLMHCKSLDKLSLTNSIYVAIFVLGIFSSYIVSLEETNIINYEYFLAHARMQNSFNALVLIISTVIILQIVKMKFKLSKSTHISYLLLALALVPIINSVIRDVFTFEDILGTGGHIGGIFLLTLAVLLLAYNFFWHKTRSIGRIIRPAVFAILVAIFSVSIVLQIGLLQDFYQEAKDSNLRGKLLDCNEYVASYNEYQRIDGYEVEKKGLYDFLVRQKCYE